MRYVIDAMEIGSSSDGSGDVSTLGLKFIFLIMRLRETHAGTQKEPKVCIHTTF